jgi:hypothetical protein
VTRPDAILELTREIDKLRGDNVVLRQRVQDLIIERLDTVRFKATYFFLGFITGASIVVASVVLL